MIMVEYDESSFYFFMSLALEYKLKHPSTILAVPDPAVHFFSYARLEPFSRARDTVKEWVSSNRARVEVIADNWKHRLRAFEEDDNKIVVVLKASSSSGTEDIALQKDDLVEMMKLPTALMMDVKQVYEKLLQEEQESTKTTKTVLGIHMNRTCGLTDCYYQRAIYEHFPTLPYLLVFCVKEDHDWSARVLNSALQKNQVTKIRCIEIQRGPEQATTMALFGLCNNMILCNTAFSVWAARFSPSTKKKVIYPGHDWKYGLVTEQNWHVVEDSVIGPESRLCFGPDRVDYDPRVFLDRELVKHRGYHATVYLVGKDLSEAIYTAVLCNYENIVCVHEGDKEDKARCRRRFRCEAHRISHLHAFPDPFHPKPVDVVYFTLSSASSSASSSLSCTVLRYSGEQKSLIVSKPYTSHHEKKEEEEEEKEDTREQEQEERGSSSYDVDLRTVPIFILSPNRYKYAKRCEATQKLLQEELKCTDIRVHEASLTPGSYKGGCKGFLDIFTQMLQGKEWRPFMVVEDDIGVYDKTLEIKVPKNADVVYLGISKCGAQPLREEFCMNLLYTNVRQFPHLKRIYNMLGTHAMLFLTKTSVQELQRRFAIQYQDHPEGAWDMRTARFQSNGGMVYALSKPLFYQAQVHGGQESVTKFELSDVGAQTSDRICKNWFV